MSLGGSNLLLSRLEMGFPGVTAALGAVHAEACRVCFTDQTHSSGVELKVKGIKETSFNILWDGEVTPQMISSWNDEPVATEYAAYGIAFLLISELTSHTVIEKSRKGTGFDYWLGDQEEIETLPFQRKARLEVSGIRNAEKESEINARVKQKKNQTQPTDGILPAYVVVVEFSRPVSFVVKK